MSISHKQLGFITAASAVLVLAADLALPLGVAGGVPYVAVVLLSLWLPGANTTLRIAAACSVLTLIGYTLSPSGGEAWKVLVNRLLALFAIWVTAILANRHNQANAFLLQKSTRLNAILEANVDGILTADENGIIESFNPSSERIFGISQDEVVGQSILSLIPESRRSSAQRQIASWGQLRDRKLPPMVVEGLRGDGTSFPMELSISNVHVNDQLLFSAIIRDITEKRRLESEFLQAQKLEAVGRFSGGIAHDFNNLLMGIIGVCQVARDRPEANDAINEDLNSIELAANDGARLTRQLLDFSRKEIVRSESIDIDRILTDQEPFLAQLVGEDVSLRVKADTNAHVLGDPTQFRQIILNLLTNARDAMPDGGAIDIQASTRVTVGSGSERLVELRVSDTGSGMNEETLTHAFDPFFTTKEEGKGTGLGLSTIYGIVSEAGGRVEASSAEGQGTTITVLWPEANAQPEESLSAKPNGSPKSSIERKMTDDVSTVLVVEDEDLVRMSVRYYLEKAGYNVRDAADATAALKIVDDSIDIVLTDMVLPGMSGAELVAAVRKKGLLVTPIFMSAWPREDLLEQGRVTADQPTLQKPFTKERLLEALEDLRSPNP